MSMCIFWSIFCPAISIAVDCSVSMDCTYRFPIYHRCLISTAWPQASEPALNVETAKTRRERERVFIEGGNDGTSR
jgi:hypothetical protein